jgi:hypothetical protein
LTRKKNDQKTFKLLENIGSAHETELELEMIELPQQKNERVESAQGVCCIQPDFASRPTLS